MKNIVVGVILACVLTAASGAAVSKTKTYRARPGDRVLIGTAALNCKVGYARITCTDPRRRSKHFTILATREELTVQRPPRKKGQRPRIVLNVRR